MKFYLAPLQDITDSVFRTICHRHGADLTFTEMIKVTSLGRKNSNALSRIKSYDKTPIIIQLIGSKEESFETFLKCFSPEPGFSGFNLNIGCPDPEIINLGLGAAMIKRIKKTQSIVKIFRKHKYPISIKLRLGLNRYEKEKKAYLNIIKSVDADFFIVHARHGQESYDVPADFSVYSECVKTGKIIIANGDIRTKEQIEHMEKQGIEGVMIGRAAVENPGIFNHLKNLPCPSVKNIITEYTLLAEKYDSPLRYRKNFFKHVKKA
ncbi:MAG: tRNA-dihydrouridine synthase family protein [Nanoarchaeota archaeon]|nr:tRNA-dihydrouridine synthase family protein [Nanoarchaeota archaeon]